MTLTVSTAITPVGAPIIDPPATIEAMARAQGSTIPAGSSVVGITVPIIRSDQTRLHYHTRNGRTEFIFNTGTLALTLRQEIHLSSALNSCARTIWHQHELKHVRDNEQLMPRMDRELRADQEFQDILVSPTEWRPVARFNDTQTAIQEIVRDVFERLTTAAAARTDSRQEYRHVERQVRIRCGHSVGRILKQGMYGQGIDIVQQALNNEPTSLPLLRVDGVFGPKTDARVREFQAQKHLIPPDGIVGPNTRRELGI
jgi:hypothetical protein